MRQIQKGLQLLAQEVGVFGDLRAEQRFDGAAPDRRAELLVDVQLLSGLPGVDDRVRVGHHGLHVVLDLLVMERGLDEAATATVLCSVAHDQSCRSNDRDEHLERVPPAEGVGVGEYELVGLRAQQIDQAVSAKPLVDHRATPPIQR